MIYDSMKDCFNTMEEKAADAIGRNDLTEIFTGLDQIKGPVLVTGVGGSAVVAVFLAKILREKNHVLASYCSPRDLLYMDLSCYEDILSVSYSGNNIGVDAALTTGKNCYLFTGHPREGFRNIVYQMQQEISYVSINATIVPMSLLFLYYCQDEKLLFDILGKEIKDSCTNDQYEVLSGYESSTAAAIFESSIIESGIGNCVVHDKYSYCHGRLNITRNTHSDLIFYRNHSPLDKMLQENLKHHYNRIITLDCKYEDPIINDFYLTLLSLKLVRNIATEKNIDISNMKEFEDNDVFYRFNGKMK